MMDEYDQYDPDLIDLTREALKAGWWVSFGVADMGYTDLETEAIRGAVAQVQPQQQWQQLGLRGGRVRWVRGGSS